MTALEWFDQNFNQLVRDYGGKYVLIRENEVIFADTSSKVVVQYARENFHDKNWEVMFIDSGEAIFYGIRVQNS